MSDKLTVEEHLQAIEQAWKVLDEHSPNSTDVRIIALGITVEELVAIVRAQQESIEILHERIDVAADRINSMGNKHG